MFTKLNTPFIHLKMKEKGNKKSNKKEHIENLKKILILKYNAYASKKFFLIFCIELKYTYQKIKTNF